MGWAWAAEAATDGGGSGYWQLIMVVAAIGFLGLFARWRKMRAPAVPSTRELRERDHEPNKYRDAADRAIVELLETSRSLNAQVDTKIRVLNRLVKEAEENIARLEKLLGEAKAVHDGEGAKESPAVRKPEKVDAPPPEPEAPRFLSDLHERIYVLRRDGKSVAEIAKATNLSTTEVEFIVKSF